MLNGYIKSADADALARYAPVLDKAQQLFAAARQSACSSAMRTRNHWPENRTTATLLTDTIICFAGYVKWVP